VAQAFISSWGSQESKRQFLDRPLLVGEGIAILELTPHGRRLEETYLARYAAGTTRLG
jgi:hypothetical protein